MAITVAKVVGQFKSDVGRALSPHAIRQACVHLGHGYRQRVLDPVTTLHAFFVQILHGNTACSELPHLTGLSFSAAAFVKARSRLPDALIERLLESIRPDIVDSRTGLWLGHRTWHMDGSSFSMSDQEELQEAFGQPGNQREGCGFPVAHFLALFHGPSGMIQRVIPAPMRTHDMANASEMHPELRAGDVLIADRAFASFTHLVLLFQRNLHGVFRCHQRQVVDFRPGRRHKKRANGPKGLPTSRWLKRLGRHDQLVEYPKPKAKPEWMEDVDFAKLPDTIVVRELRFIIREPACRTREVTLVTTLLDPIRYPAQAIAELYRQRWRIEVNLRHLKTTMKMEVLRCHTVEGVIKELLMFALAYNLVRRVMLEAADRQKIPVERISFIDALRWLRTAQPGTPLPKLIVLPIRPHRHEPRCLKRRPKGYSRMIKPRDQLRQMLQKTRPAA
jgi:hypothetical protein